MKAEILWSVRIKIKIEGHDWDIALTANEQSVLGMLRMAYETLEGQLKRMVSVRPGDLPAGLLNEIFALLRCLVFNKLERISGTHIKLESITK